MSAYLYATTKGRLRREGWAAEMQMRASVITALRAGGGEEEATRIKEEGVGGHVDGR